MTTWRRPKRARANPSDGKWTYSPLTLDDLDAAVERARERLQNNPQFIAKQERLGRERELIFKTLVLTGLRKGELASVTVGQPDLDSDFPQVTLNAADERNREGNSLPLRADLADDLRMWLATLQSERQGASDVDGKRVALTFQRDAGDALSLSTPLFKVPAGLVRILDRDLVAAGIPKRDERGRTIDVHALRHSFGTLLSKGGVTPRTAQAAMRHSDIALTMTTYTDPKLLDVQGALDALPSLPLTDSPTPKREAMRATGTDHARSLLGQGLGKIGTSEGILSHSLTHSPTLTAVAGSTHRLAENPEKPNEKALFAGFANKAFQVERKGVEPSTSALRTQRPTHTTQSLQRVVATDDFGCSNGCSSSPENERGEMVGKSISSRAESLPIKADSFSAALAMIASLPLSDAEKADAVRRLMAEQARGARGKPGE